MNIKETAQIAHALAKEKGFWDTERNFDECLMLIVSEVGEAMEAHRTGRMISTEDACESLPGVSGLDLTLSAFHPGSDYDFKTCYEKYIKGTFEEEIADVAIRLMDLMVGFGFPIKEEIEPPEYAERWSDNVGQCLKIITEQVVAIIEYGSPIERTYPFITLSSVFRYAAQLDINLEWHINAKIKYNATRERMHGKAY